MVNKERDEKDVPNVSGSFQIVDDKMKKDIKEDHLDEDVSYYARNFSE